MPISISITMVKVHRCRYMMMFLLFNIANIPIHAANIPRLPEKVAVMKMGGIVACKILLYPNSLVGTFMPYTTTILPIVIKRQLKKTNSFIEYRSTIDQYMILNSMGIGTHTHTLNPLSILLSICKLQIFNAISSML